MAEIADALLGFAAILGVFGFPVLALYLGLSHRRQMRALEIQKMEAQTRLLQAQRGAEVPGYIDRDDPHAMAAYREAQEELNRAAARHAVAQQRAKS